MRNQHLATLRKSSSIRLLHSHIFLILLFLSFSSIDQHVFKLGGKKRRQRCHGVQPQIIQGAPLPLSGAVSARTGWFGDLWPCTVILLCFPALIMSTQSNQLIIFQFKTVYWALERESNNADVKDRTFSSYIWISFPRFICFMEQNCMFNCQVQVQINKRSTELSVVKRVIDCLF